MSKSAFSELVSEQHLSSVWGDMYKSSKPKKRNGYGIDGISINQFRDDEALIIKRLSSDLLANRYRPQLLNPHFIPKSNGKDRVICIPTVTDRLIQRALLQFLHKKNYGFENSISFGFVKGKSVKMAAQQAIEYRDFKPWAYKADISSFFDNIDRKLLIRQVNKKIRMRSLHPIITSIINTEILCRHSGESKKVRKLGIKTGTGLRQGMPASPYLANLMLLDFDRAIESSGIPMVRYADDLIAFANSEQECIDIHNKCTLLLEKEGLMIHPISATGKTQIAKPSNTIEFLGLGLAPSRGSYNLIVTVEQFNSIKQKILQFSDLNYCIKNNISISKLTRKLEDKVNGYYGAYGLCDNFDQLSHTIEAARSEVMSKLFVKQFGIDYKSLTNKQKQFLEI